MLIGHRLRTLFLVSVASICTCVGILSGQTPQPAPAIPELEVGRAIDGDLTGGQSTPYRVALTAGQFVLIVVEQLGINLGATVRRPDGSIFINAIYSPDEFLPERVVAIADVSGMFSVEVRANSKTSPPGRYQIRLDVRRPATPDDRIRVEAERTFERAAMIGSAFIATDYPKAIDGYTAARDLYQRVGDRYGEMRVLLERAILEWRLARPAAIESARASEQIAIELKNEEMRARAIELRGGALGDTGDLATSLRLYEEALAIFETIGHRSAEATALNDVGMVYGRTGDSDRALARFERGLAIAEEQDDPQLKSLLNNNVGIAYKNVGEYDKALAAYQSVLTTPQLNRALRATTLNNAGNVQRLLGHDREALAMHLEALDIARAIGNKENEARSLNTIGQTYFSLGEYDTALKHEDESLVIRRSLADLPGQSASLDAIGRTLQRLGNTDRAYASLTEALTIRRSIRDQYGEPGTLRTLALVDRDRGDLARALDDIKAAVDLDEELRARITSPELRATFVASEMDKYELYIDLLQQKDAADPAGGYAAAALQVSERARARVLLESLLDARVDLRQGIDPALLDRERSLQKQLSAVSAQISRSLAGGRKDPPPDLAENYARLTAEYRQHLATIRQQSPHYAAVTQPEPLDLKSIQQSVVDDATVLLEFELGTDKSWLWAVTPKSLTSVPLPPRREIDTAARALYDTLTARQKRPGEAGAAYAKRVTSADAALNAQAATMSRMLLSGIAGRLQNEWRDKRLAIVSAGSLEYLPFAALPVPGAGPKTLLVSRHEIVKIPSASVLAVLRKEAGTRTPAPRALAIVADPVFDATDPRVGVATKPSAPPHEPATQSLGDVDEALYVRSGLARLPFSREEANAIAMLAGAKDVFKAVDFNASRSTALDGSLAGYRIVHLATHGVLDSTRPSLSGLVLSLVDERGQRRDGFVRLHDIYNMRLDADLVVLSACQTALGKDIKGEGLIGLTRAFMYAGTPRVVASLWEVSDLATAELMKKFYAAMLQRHLPAAAALKAAQLEMAQDPRWSSPYYWAGFVFQGDWK